MKLLQETVLSIGGILGDFLVDGLNSFRQMLLGLLTRFFLGTGLVLFPGRFGEFEVLDLEVFVQL